MSARMTCGLSPVGSVPQCSVAEADVRALRSIMTALCRRCGTKRAFAAAAPMAAFAEPLKL